MPEARVQVQGLVPRPAGEVWALARAFAHPWHPAIATMAAEHDAQGALIRRFTVAGEATVYRERRSFLSDSDRVLGYTHLQGIAGCEAYEARISVKPGPRGTKVIWEAAIRAPERRLAAIRAGTEAIFRQGIAALATAAPPGGPSAGKDPAQRGGRLGPLVLGGTPRLGLTLPPDRGQKTLVLFLHGIGGNRGNWRGQLAALPAQVRGAALDLRGYGDSALGPRPSRVADYWADIRRVRRVLGAERLVLVGLSYGAWLAAGFALHHPGALAGLVLAGGATGMSEAGPAEREAFRRAREVPLSQGQTPADFAPAVVSVLAGPGAGRATRQWLFDSMAAIPTATYRDALACFTQPPERFDFARLGCPVLLMTGQHDRLAPPAEIRGVANRIASLAPHPDVTFEVIAGAGHVCNLERPRAFDRHLGAFLRRVAP